MDHQYLKLYQAIEDQKLTLINYLTKLDRQIVAVTRQRPNASDGAAAINHRNVSLEMLKILEKYIEMNYNLESLIEEESLHPSILDHADPPIDTSLMASAVEPAESREQLSENPQELPELHPLPDNDINDTVSLLSELDRDEDNEQPVLGTRASSISSNSTDNSAIPVRDLNPSDFFDITMNSSHKIEVAPLQRFTALEALQQVQIHDREKEMDKKRVRFNIIPKNFQLVEVPQIEPPKKDTKAVVLLPTYEIIEDKLMADQKCTICHVVTPSEFYVHTNIPLLDMLMTSLNDEMNSKTFFVKTKYPSKEDARNTLGDFCVAYLPDRGNYHRVRVIDWMDDNREDEDVVLIQLVDVGEKLYNELCCLRRLDEIFSNVPALAIRCQLAYLQPPGGVWLEPTNELFCKMVEDQQLTVIFVTKIDQSSPYLVDLCPSDDLDADTISEVLIRRGMAVGDGLASSLLDVIAEDDDEEEFETINEALLGYHGTDEARICPFTNSSGGCYKGVRCKLEHGKLSEDGITTDKIEIFSEAFEEMAVPAIGECLNIVVTAYITPCKFYIHIISEKRENGSFSTRKFRQPTVPQRKNSCDANFHNLLDVMHSKEKVSNYKKMKIYPSIGEICLVKHANGQWLRGKCTRLDDLKIEMFLVDFGLKYETSLKQLFEIEEEFLHVPFQAVGCNLYNCSPRFDVDADAAKKFFVEHVAWKEFYARVISNNRPLSLEILDQKDYADLGVVLQHFGFADESYDNDGPAESYKLQLE